MFNLHSEPLSGFDGQLVSIGSNHGVLSFKDVFELWVHEKDFRAFFIEILAELPYAAIRWELPPVKSATAVRPFECVIINGPDLDTKADLHTFRGLFDRLPAGDVGVSPNLGGDALMILPSPVNDESSYSHLLAFIRTAPDQQRHRFWKVVGEATISRLSAEPVWLNTAGGGVAWLHARLDDRPKYYVYSAYRHTVA